MKIKSVSAVAGFGYGSISRFTLYDVDWISRRPNFTTRSLKDSLRSTHQASIHSHRLSSFFLGNKIEGDDATSNYSPENKRISKINQEHSGENIGQSNHVPSPPPFLAFGYTVASLLNTLTSIALIFNCVKTIVSKNPFSPTTVANLSSPYRPNLLATYTAGTLGYMLLAAGSCHILSESVNTKRLRTSDTYKRLTFGTLLFGFMGLLSIPGEAGCSSIITMTTFPLSVSTVSMSSTILSVSFVITQLAKLQTAIVSFIGWEYSAGGFGTQRIKNILQEVRQDFCKVWNSLPVTIERPASFYRSFFLFVTLGNVLFNLPELVFHLTHQQGRGIFSLFSLPVSLTISSMARLTLLSVILYILKDAADRNRLNGSTFIKLNLMVGLWAWGVGIGQGLQVAEGVPVFSVRKAADKLLFGVLFLNNGIMSLRKKLGIVDSVTDNIDEDGTPPLRINIL